MDSIEEIHEYASKYLDFLGEGASRATYLLSSRKVLKVAINDRGRAQNEAEVDLYTSPATRPVITKVFHYDPDYKWIISGLVKPLALEENPTGQGPWEEVFSEKFGVNFSSFTFVLWDVIERGESVDGYIDYIRENYETHPGMEGYFKFFRAVVATVRSGALVIGDVETPVHGERHRTDGSSSSITASRKKSRKRIIGKKVE